MQSEERCNVWRSGRSLMEKFVLFLLFVSTAHCADVSLSWNANSESDLAGYRLHWGITSGSPTQDKDVGNFTTGTITGLETGVRYFITVTAYNTSRLESGPSNEVSYTPSTLIPQATSKLTVINGSGSSVYPTGSIVKVSANGPPQVRYLPCGWVIQRLLRMFLRLKRRYLYRRRMSPLRQHIGDK